MRGKLRLRMAKTKHLRVFAVLVQAIFLQPYCTSSKMCMHMLQSSLSFPFLEGGARGGLGQTKMS